MYHHADYIYDDSIDENLVIRMYFKIQFAGLLEAAGSQGGMWRDLGDLDQEHPKQNLTDDDLDNDDDDDYDKEHPKQDLTDDAILNILLPKNITISMRITTCVLHISLVIYFDICPG